MLNDFLKSTADEERIEMEKLRQDLEALNAQRVADLEEQKRKDKQALITGKAAVDALEEKNRREQEY